MAQLRPGTPSSPVEWDPGYGATTSEQRDFNLILWCSCEVLMQVAGAIPVCDIGGIETNKI